jgi:hypothetical protein
MKVNHMNKPAKIFFYLTCLVFFSEISMGTPVPTKIQAVNENSLQNRLLDGSVPSNFSSEKQVDKINLNGYFLKYFNKNELLCVNANDSEFTIELDGIEFENVPI